MNKKNIIRRLHRFTQISCEASGFEEAGVLEFVKSVESVDKAFFS